MTEGPKFAIICDIDGVLVDAQPIYDIVDQKVEGPVGPEHYKAYDALAEQAKNSVSGRILLQMLANLSPSIDIFFATSRHERVREKTIKALKAFGISNIQSAIDNRLLMRTEGYDVPTVQVKARQIQQVKYLGYTPLMFIDDSIANCAVALKLGVPAMRAQCVEPESIKYL